MFGIKTDIKSKGTLLIHITLLVIDYSLSNPTLSVKCSPYTKQNLINLFLKNDHFLDLQKNNVYPTISWFFKQSANIYLELLNNNVYALPKSHLELFNYDNAFDNQFANTLDDAIKNLISHKY